MKKFNRCVSCDSLTYRTKFCNEICACVESLVNTFNLTKESKDTLKATIETIINIQIRKRNEELQKIPFTFGEIEVVTFCKMCKTPFRHSRSGGYRYCSNECRQAGFTELRKISQTKNKEIKLEKRELMKKERHEVKERVNAVREEKIMERRERDEKFQTIMNPLRSLLVGNVVHLTKNQSIALGEIIPHRYSWTICNLDRLQEVINKIMDGTIT